MKTKLCVLALAALVAFGLKRHYSAAGPDDLWWILTPTARVVGAVTGVSFVVIPSEGHVSHERLFVIEKSCAGINFMVAAFGMLIFALRHRIRSGRSALCVLAVSLAAGYAAAIVVNAARITIALWLAGRPPAFASLSQAEVHRIEGIVVYFGGLMLLCELARRVDRAALAARIS